MNAATELRSHTPKGQRARELILTRAEVVFAERGFHGASMRELAAEAGLPLATLVYHFARKEQLYAAVLSAIASQLDAMFAAAAPVTAETSAAELQHALDSFVRVLVHWGLREPRRVGLLLRELVDNPPRVERARTLPLAPFLTRASELVGMAARAGVAHAPVPELAVLQLVGSVSYVVASRPTVARIVGKTRARVLAAAFEPEAVAFAHRALGMSAAPRPRRPGAEP